MGSGGWIKTIINRKKARQGKSQETKVSSASAGTANGSQSEDQSQQNACDGAACGANRVLCMPKEHTAAVHIQTAFRAYLARKALRRMKGAVRLQNLPQHQSVKKQSISTLNHLQSWTTMQTEIQIRRRSMVLEAQTKQKKLENHSKLEAKLQDLDVDWCGGSETMEEILARINQREEAAVKRERALAYAFSHQWRANCVQREGTKTSGLSKANWGWSWKERWVAARPWENLLQSQSVSPKKEKNTSASKASKNDSSSITQRSVTVKSSAPNGKGPACRAQRLSFPESAEQAINSRAREATVSRG